MIISKDKFPKVIVSSVIRSSHQGESHGGLYLLDLEKEHFRKVLDWNDCNINWEGRGGDRGLRGIAFHKEDIYIAASDEIFIMDRDFSIKDSIKNRYMKHCHEIFIYEDTLYITSTGFDSVLEFNILSQKFVRGYYLRYRGIIIPRILKKVNVNIMPGLKIFNPNSNDGPEAGDNLHINNVYCENSVIYVSGTRLRGILYIRDLKARSLARIPYGTHNARPFKKGILLNNTRAESIQYIDRSGKIKASFLIKRYNEKELLNSKLPKDHARQAFARGLCVYKNDYIIGGSSPSTISLYHFDDQIPLKAINLTLDIRNAVHGLEVWPF